MNRSVSLSVPFHIKKYHLIVFNFENYKNNERALNENFGMIDNVLTLPPVFKMIVLFGRVEFSIFVLITCAKASSTSLDISSSRVTLKRSDIVVCEVDGL